MSVHSHTAAQYEAATPEFPRHVVTAVLVSHDGARWLPEALSGLLSQERPVQDVIAADTGSADESAQLLTESLGPDRVLHMARRTGFGAAVDEAARTARVPTPDDLPYLKRPSGWDPVNRTWRDDAYDMPELPHGEPVQWLWLLHDDCAPEPDALARLLRIVDADPEATLVGPKLRSWYDRRQLLEAGVTIANSGRRWTGVERREQDQGQHDQVRAVLSVSSAGMLVRRDVFEELGGFDRHLPLMRDDVDLCWRAHSAGHKVLIVPDAVVRHAEAAARERRPVDCVGRGARGGASPHRVDKAGAVYTLLANVPGSKLFWVMLRLVLGTMLRTLAYLVGKVPGRALDEVRGLTGTLLRPGRIIGARRRRGRPAVPYSELRHLFPPPGATVRATAEQVASNFGGRAEPDMSSGGRHGAVESGPGDDDADFLEVEQFARLKQIARKPGPVLFAVLLVVSLIACRELLGGGALAGGALLPAPAEVSDLWGRYVDGWHPVGVGGTQTAPPYLAIVAMVATVFFGSTGFALTLLLVCSVPLAGFTAYFTSRPLVESRLLRAWGSVAYAFLPAATGALAGGRIGTAVLAVTLPLLARSAVAVSGLRGRPGWRAVWGYALLLTLTSAFTPLVWLIAVTLAAVLLVLRRLDLVDGPEQSADGPVRGIAVRNGIALLTPMVLLAPWSLSLLTDPASLFREAGLQYGAGSGDALGLLTLTPGGPGAAGGLLLVGVVLAALAALLRDERQSTIRAAWVVALVGLLYAGISNSVAWAGPATLVYGLALLCAAVVGAEGAKERVAEQNFGWKQPAAALVAAAAVAAPLVAAVGWMVGGADGPLSRRDPVQVPAFVAEESRTSDQARTLVLSGEADDASSAPANVSYSIVRGSGARLGDGDLAVAGGDDARLGRVVANLVAGSGADQTEQLGGYAVRYVLVKDDAPRQMSRVLDATPGLTRRSQEDGSALWRVDRQVSRVSVLPAGAGSGSGRAGGAAGEKADPVPVPAGPLEVHTELRPGDAGRVLRIADAADPGWQATLNGRPLDPVTLDGWAQGFELPAGGGQLDVTHETSAAHTAWVWLQGFLALVVVVLALPGRRRQVDDDLPETAAAVPAPGAEGGRRARRLAAAEAARAAEGRDDSDSDADGVPDADPRGAEVPAQSPYEQPRDGREFEPASGYEPSAYGSSGYDSRYGASGASSYESSSYESSAYESPSYEPSYDTAPSEPRQRPYGDGGTYDEGYGQQYDDGYATRQFDSRQYDAYEGQTDPYGYDPRYGNRSDQQ
ncbi:glycosyltransferase family 2 protein [Streptomyces marispadix]|uniref:Glycosyltransferase family 2 protein n=1 Tax=Streptomyces marispadix TaxID=2922868 RepID=A0ABS9SWG9_9ACTN|nr:glycosyltransferase family 2 protein [Streptomyces marispadix]MCH6160623.1 glycosyltransferase family 2 protein [Streptomyces marispadix]